tara:strand:- start:2060 stop:2743 length:684 start_codon:yes stop_codon:yes gene_type:complete
MKILKKGESGKGILIERDAGYINPRDNDEIRLIESNNPNKPFIEEPLVLTAVLQKCGVENRNGRIYPSEILKKEVQNYQELIKQNRAIGEAEHPESSVINTDRVSHNILKTWWDGKTLMGKVEILMSPGFTKSGIISCKGDMIANLLRKGIMIGVSSRGVGTLNNEQGKNIVQDDFELICWDIVTSPSTPGSWMFKNEEEARPFVENEEKIKPLIIDNLDSFLDEEG